MLRFAAARTKLPVFTISKKVRAATISIQRNITDIKQQFYSFA